MTTIKTGIGLLVIAVAVIILIFTFRKFVFPALGEFGKATGDAFSSASKGFTDFFNSFDTQAKADEAQAIFDAQVKQKEQDAKNAGFSSVEEFEKATDKNNDPFKFNPKGVIGYGYMDLNNGLGLPDTPGNRIKLDDFLKNKNSSGSTSSNIVKRTESGISANVKEGAVYDKILGFIFPKSNEPALHEAHAEVQQNPFGVIGEVPFTDLKPIEVNQDSVDINRQIVSMLNPRDVTTKSIKSERQGNTTIQGTVINRINTDQQFQAFSSDSSKPVTGSINPTPINRTKLLVDSNKKPLETASERANRVFLETGNFVDVKRGASSFDNKFDFGTNDSSALKLPTVNIAGTKGDIVAERIQRQRIAQLKKIEEQKALAKFNEELITRF